MAFQPFTITENGMLVRLEACDKEIMPGGSAALQACCYLLVSGGLGLSLVPFNNRHMLQDTKAGVHTGCEECFWGQGVLQTIPRRGFIVALRRGFIMSSTCDL
jgi:hypothetical protein